MKKTLSLLVLLLTLFSCSEKVDVTSFDFAPAIQTTSGTVTNVQQPISFSLKVNGVDESTEGKLDVTFSVKNGTGNLIVDDQTLEIGEKFSHNFIEDPVAKLKYLPKTSGKHTISLSLANSKVSKTVTLDVDVNDMVINLVPTNIPQITVIEKRFSFDLNLSGKNLADLGECTLKALVSKGSGDIYKEDVLISQEGKSGVLKEGRNVISYYAKEAGENILKFDVTSQYGYSQELLVPIEICKPEFTVISSIDVDSLPVAPAAQDFSFKLKLTDDFQHEGMKFTGKYRFISNNGAVKVNSKTVTSGADTEFKLGENVIVFNGSDAGIVDMEFIITNQYGVQKVERVKFDVGGGNISLSVRQIHTEVDLLDSTPIELTIVRPGYSGSFQLGVTAIKGSGAIVFGNQEHKISTGWISGFTNKETISFKPNKLEDIEMEFTVRDPKGETVSNPIVLKYKVNNPPINVSVKGYSSNVMVNATTNFSLVINKKNYTGDFKYSVLTDPLNVGRIMVDGAEPRPNMNNVNSPLNMIIQFTPTSFPANGNVSLNFTFTDEYSTIKDTSIMFNVQTPPINVWFDADRKEYPIGEATRFNSRITSSGHENTPFDITIKSKNTPLASWNGSKFTGISVIKAYNDQLNEVMLQPVAKGENPIKFVITDQYGKSIEKEITVVGAVVNNISVREMSSPVLMPDASKGDITIKSNDPDNEFFVSYRILKGDGALRVNGQQLHVGGSIKVHQGDSEGVIPIQYTSNTEGDAIIEISVMDAYGTVYKQNATTVFRGEIVITGKVSSMGKTATLTVTSEEPVRDDVRVNLNFIYNIAVGNSRAYVDNKYITIKKGATSGSITQTTNDRFVAPKVQLISVSPEIGGDGSKYVIKN